MPDETTKPDLDRPTRKSRFWIWFVWLGAFYTTWLCLVLIGDHWQTIKDHWAIAVSMALGSYVAGSTPMGGGTVGFPILVLLFDQSTSLGRDFSYAVQAIGMTSAWIFIVSRRLPVAWPMLGGAMIASLIGTPIGLLWIAEVVPPTQAKLVFAVGWAAFGILHFIKSKQFCGYQGNHHGDARSQFKAGAITGLLASMTVAAISGVGIDMMVYAVLVLMFRCDLKIAIPTSVIIMAFTSLVGIGFRAANGDVVPGVFENWLAAAPVVALGAPLGVFVVNLVGRHFTLMAVSVLCIVQFLWTCHDERANLGLGGFALAVVGVAVTLGLFTWLYQIGKRLSQRLDAAAALHTLEEGRAASGDAPLSSE